MAENSEDEAYQRELRKAATGHFQEFQGIPWDSNMVNRKLEAVQHPQYYGGADNPYEAIKVITSCRLGFNVGNTTKYVLRSGKKGPAIVDLEKAVQYLDFEIEGVKTLKKIDPADVADAHNLSRWLTLAAINLLHSTSNKGTIGDLKTARFYLRREIARLSK